MCLWHFPFLDIFNLSVYPCMFSQLAKKQNKEKKKTETSSYCVPAPVN